MILNLIQKNILLKDVKDMLDTYGENQKTYELIHKINMCPMYEIETNGKDIVFIDLKDPDVFRFDNYEDFKNFILREL